MPRVPLGIAAENALGRRAGAVGPASGRGSSAPPSFIITAVSQTEGKAAGGTVITVTAAGITGTPTSTLGTVSNVTTSTFQITTAGGSGVVAWTAKNGNGILSSSQSYTYLAVPAFSSITPTSGPQTLATPGVVVAASGLPMAGSGCPVSCTIDGNAVTALTLGSGASFTCTVPTDTSFGAKNVVVTVDGVVASGGTGAWTYNPPPSELSATNVGTMGGSSTISGQYFVNGITAVANINGTSTPLTVTYTSSQIIAGALASGNYTAGTWPLTVTNPDGQSTTATIFTITTVSNPQTIFGANLIAQWIADDATTSGGAVVSVPDQTGHGFTLTPGTNAPAIIASDPNYNGHASVWHNSTSTVTSLQNTSLALGSGDIITTYMGLDMIAATNTAALNFASSLYVPQLTSSGNAQVKYAANALANPAVITGTPVTLISSINGNTASGSVAINNQTATTGTVASASVPSGAETAVIGFNVAGDFTWPEMGVINRIATSAEALELTQYLNLTYQVTPAPTFISMTKALALTANTPARINGSGFLASPTVTVSGGIGTLTVLESGSTWIDVSIPSAAAGSYNVTVTNVDGQSITANNALVLASSFTNPMTIFGLSCVGWYEPSAGNYTLNGSNISSLFDQSCSGNTLSQATSAYQPALVTSDADFSGHNSVDMAGSANNNIGNGSTDMHMSTGSLYLLVTQKIVTATFPSYIASYGGYYLDSNNGQPDTYVSSTHATWPTNIAGSTQNVVSRFSSNTIGTNVGNSASEVTASFTGGSSQVISLSIGSAGYCWKGKFAIAVLLNAAPNSTQLAAWETFDQGYGAA